MNADASLKLLADAHLYAVAHRPLRRTRLAVGQPLPMMSLALSAGLVIPVDFEATHADACRRKRLTGA